MGNFIPTRGVLDDDKKQQLFEYLMKRQESQDRDKERAGYAEALTKLSSAFSNRNPDVSSYQKIQGKEDIVSPGDVAQLSATPEVSKTQYLNGFTDDKGHPIPLDKNGNVPPDITTMPSNAYNQQLAQNTKAAPPPDLMSGWQTQSGEPVFYDKASKTTVDAGGKPAHAMKQPSQAEEGRQEKQVTAVGEKLGNSQEAFSAIQNLENNLGFKLDDYDANKKTVRGKSVDIPGMSVPLLGRVSAYSEKAREIDSAAASIFNRVIKDRSGQAVTSTEMERLKNEFAAGKYNDESELLKALKQYKQAALVAMQNVESRYDPSSVAEYAKRGGFTKKQAEGFTPKESDAYLSGAGASATAAPAVAPPRAGYIRMTNGSETHDVLPKNIEKARKDGFTEVK